MRLSLVLLRQHMGFHLKQEWKRRGQRKIIDHGVPATLLEKGVEIKDAREVAKPVWPVIAYPPPPPELDFEPPEEGPEHPNWKDRPCLTFTHHRRLLEGEKQMLLLTKTAKRVGLPPSILERAENISIPDQDELVQRALLHSHLLEGTQHRLARHYTLGTTARMPPRSYGVRRRKANQYLIMNLMRLCSSLNGKYPQLFNSELLQQAQIYFCMEKEGDLLNFDCTGRFVLLGEQPMSAFANEQEVQATVDHKLPDMFPVKCTLDLRERHVYSLEEKFATDIRAKELHPHLVVIHNDAHTRVFKDHHLNACALGTAFAFAASRARFLYGPEVREIPTPITVQIALITCDRTQFLVFQLNTLDLDSEAGIKNIAWFEDACQVMYSKCELVDGLPTLEDYNPVIMKRLLAMYSSPVDVL